MKKLLFLILLSILFTAPGCDRPPGLNSIAGETELLDEAAFEFRYPKDWKILSEEDNTQSGQRATIYRFRHPVNRECMINIEILSFSNRALSPVREITTREVRIYKDSFRSLGYGNFSFRTTSGSLADQEATKLIMTGEKSGITKTTTIYILAYKGDYYTVSYPGFSHWKSEIETRLKEIIRTFRFAH